MNKLTPHTIMETSNNYRQSAVLFAAHRLRVFDYVEEPVSPEYAAKLMKTDTRAIEILLNALSGLGLLEKKGDSFCNSPVSSVFLRKDSPKYIGAMIDHNMNAVSKWMNIDKVVLTGEPMPGLASDKFLRKNKKTTKNFILAMEAASIGPAAEMADMIPLENVKTMLDLGGGPGIHTFEIIKRKPNIKGIVFDLPIALETTKKLVKKYKMTKNVTTKEGDFHKDNLGDNFDLILMSNILHSHSHDECRKLVTKAFGALNINGQLVISEYVLDESGTSPLQSVLFSINMLISTSQGASYKRSDIALWLESAGFSDISYELFSKNYTLIRSIKTRR